MYTSIQVTVHLAIILSRVYYGDGSYNIERDVARIAGVDPPKRWLVFMEAEVRKCTQLMFGSFNGNVVALLRCLNHFPKPNKRCFLNIGNQLGSTELVTYANSIIVTYPMRNRSYDSSCRLYWFLDHRIYVHKLFTLKLTILRFNAITWSNVRSVRENCPGDMPSVRITYAGVSDVYCGQKYPWSIYSYSGMVMVHFYYSTSRRSLINMKVTLEIIDQDFIHTQIQPRESNFVAWRSYKIQMTHISVVLLYQIVISVVTSDDGKLSDYDIYDGPNTLVPCLNAYNNTQDGVQYKSSTYQVYIIYIPASNISTFSIHYTTYGNPTVHALHTDEHVILINNTGCGDSSPMAWMCTFNVHCHDNKHAFFKLIYIYVTGPFANMSTSAGIAVYNVVNNKPVLARHFYNSMELSKDSLTITSTENQLLFSVYAYSSLAQVSCILATGISDCVGIFIDSHIPPSIARITKHTFYKISAIESKTSKFVATVNVGDDCLSMHTSVLPTEYDVSWTQIVFAFVYNTALKVTKRFVQPFALAKCGSVKIIGDYKPIQGPFEVVGSIKSILIEAWNECGNMPVVIFTVYQIPCILPCHEISNVISSVPGIVDKCNICNFIYIDRNACNTYKTLPEVSTIFEHVFGDHALTILIKSPEYALRQKLSNEFYGYYISYHVDALVLQLEDVRIVKVGVAGRDLWKIPKGSMEIYHEEPYRITPVPRDIEVFRLGMYEYFVAGGSPLLSWHTEANRCINHGGHLLTISDQRELDFVVQKIIKPFKIEILWIGMKRQVCRVLQFIMSQQQSKY